MSTATSSSTTSCPPPLRGMSVEVPPRDLVAAVGMLLESVLDWWEVVVACSMGSVCPEPAAGSVSAGAMVVVVVVSTPVGAALSAVAAGVVAPALTALDAATDGRRRCPHRTTMATWRPRCVVVCMYVCMYVGVQCM